MLNQRGVRASVDDWLGKFGSMDTFGVLSESDDCIVIRKNKRYPLVPEQALLCRFEMNARSKK